MRVPLLLACQCVDLLEFRTLALSLLFIATSDHAVFVLINLLIYEKLPNDISERQVLLLDPVLATGNSANRAIQLLIEKGFPESQFTFLNLISAPEGIQCVCKRFPSLKIVTSEIDVA
ncbi:hypothetical protein KPL70_003345 [Citrus sinensis]|nr:hypothetical protein KPL70_003345 [Citrus sinensis]